MGQKANPKVLRLKIVQDYENMWYSTKDYSSYLYEDYTIRNYVLNHLKRSSVSQVKLYRKDSDKVFLDILSAKPGMILGKGGDLITKFRETLQRKFNKTFVINIIEEKNPEKRAKLLAEIVAAQLEKRVPFRRAMKMVVQTALKAGAEGVQISCAGRLGGVEIARTEWYQKGRMPLHTFRAKIDYSFVEANTIYGKIGIKVWINNGEQTMKTANNAAESNVSTEDKVS